ncbi:MAG: nucleotidyltransferase family protein, partial [Candidatus Nitrosothermus koennekii]
MKAVILAGGLGTRMQPYTFFMPKPMLPIADKPLLEHIIYWLKNNGINDIVICISYLGKTIEEYFSNGKELGVNIEYARSERPLGTAGQLKSAERLINDRFICLYGDGIYEFNLRDVIDTHLNKNAFVTMTLMKYSKKLEYGFIEVDGDGRVKAWNEKPEYQGLINIGCYVMEPEIFNYIPNSSSGMDDLFLRLLNENKPIYSYIIESGFTDIGNKRA